VIPYPVLAHSWGWDEILYFAVPVTGAFLWVRWIEKRARRRSDEEAEATTQEHDA
jgi:hypothetical protein